MAKDPLKDSKQATDKAATDKVDSSKAPKEKPGKESAEARRKRRRDVFSWVLLISAGLFFLSIRFRTTLASPWQEIAVVLLFLLPVLVLTLFFWAYPHPLRSMNKKLAAEREALKKETRKKKRKKF